MLCAVKAKTSEEAKAAIQDDGGIVKDLLQPPIAAVVMPGATITNSDSKEVTIQLRSGVILLCTRLEEGTIQLDIVK